MGLPLLKLVNIREIFPLLPGQLIGEVRTLQLRPFRPLGDVLAPTNDTDLSPRPGPDMIPTITPGHQINF